MAYGFNDDKTKEEVYTKTESYSKSEVYNKTEVAIKYVSLTGSVSVPANGIATVSLTNENTYEGYTGLAFQNIYINDSYPDVILRAYDAALSSDNTIAARVQLKNTGDSRVTVSVTVGLWLMGDAIQR